MSSTTRSLPVAVTGLGLITPLGDTPEAVHTALLAGRTAIEPGPERGPALSRLVDFDARRYANIRGMRVYPRNTQLHISAAMQAVTHAGIALSELDPTQLGTITASTYAHVETLLEYDRGLVTAGIQRTNPTLFPLALPSAPGALTALSLGAKAFAITLSDGDASGLAALAHGARLLAQGRAEVCVVTGAFTACTELMASADRAGMLTDPDGFRPFDQTSRGTLFGELGVALVLELPARAHARGRAALGYVQGHGAAFAPEPGLRESALVRASRAALERAAVAPDALSLVSAGASGLADHDGAEGRALVSVLGEARSRGVVSAVKSLLGESLDASGLVQTASALLSLHGRVAPPIAKLRDPRVEGLRYARTASELEGGAALVTSLSHAGSASALVVSGSP